jgi:hypothetical protein
MVPIYFMVKIISSQYMDWICSHESSIGLGYCHHFAISQTMHQMVHWCKVLPSSCVFFK